MKVTKKILGNLEKTYALALIIYQGQPHFLVASELEKPCLLFDLAGNQKDVVWEKPGGVMSMVYVPGSNGQFLTTHRFYSFNDAEDAVISVVTPMEQGNWHIQTLVKLPYVHRIDIVERGGVRYLIACQLKSGQEYENDWRFPGKLYAAVLPDDLMQFNEDHPLALTLLRDDLPRNHGYYRVMQGEIPICIISAESGVYSMIPPETPGASWTTETLVNDPASDAVLCDFDGDGLQELGVISPFHGDRVRIYHQQNGTYQMVYEYEKSIPFCHGFFGGSLWGRQRLVVGHRSGDRDLISFTYDAARSSYVCEQLDHDVGPANLLVCQEDGTDILIAANREIDEIAMYLPEENVEKRSAEYAGRVKAGGI